jgi:hypothetical protein
MNAHVQTGTCVPVVSPPAMTEQQQRATKNWLLSRLRSGRTGIVLVLNYIDEIGKDLAADRITNEQAAHDLNVIEETPLLYLSTFLVPELMGAE